MQPIVLSIETCTLAGSLSLNRGNELLGSVLGPVGTSHSNTLLKEIDQLLTSTGIQLKEVDLFAVAVGPGSFTGLRIGIATVKALAATLTKPAVGVSTLEAIALAGGPSDGTVALLPAGRGELFTQLLSVSEHHAVTQLDTPAHLTPEKMLARYGDYSDLLWAGPGALAQEQLIKQRARELSAGTNWKFAPDSGNLAVCCGELAMQSYRVGKLEQPHELRAVYVRPSDAELKN